MVSTFCFIYLSFKKNFFYYFIAALKIVYLYMLFGREFLEVQRAIIMVIHFWYKFQKY